MQRDQLEDLIQSVARHRDEVLRLVTERRAVLLAKAKAPAAGDVVHLRMDYVRDPAQPELTLQRFDRPEGQRAAAATAGEPKVVTEVVKNWFPKVEPRLSVPRATGYLVPAAYQDVVKTLLHHGILVQIFTADAPLDAEVYEVTDVVPAKDDYVAPEKLTVTKKTVRLLHRGGAAGCQPRAEPARAAVRVRVHPVSCLQADAREREHVRHLQDHESREPAGRAV